MIEVDGLTVRFGGVVPIDRMTVSFYSGTCGLSDPTVPARRRSSTC